MTESEFEELWQRAEAESHGKRFAAEYGDWRLKQRRIKGAVVATVVVAAMAFPLLKMQPHQSRDYDKIYCNRVGTDDAQWASLASEMLMEI